MGGKKQPLARELHRKAVGHQLPDGRVGGERSAPARERKDVSLTARAPVEGVLGKARRGGRAVGGARALGDRIRKERGVRVQDEARERVVPEGIKFGHVGEVERLLVQTPVVKERLENEEPGRRVPVHLTKVRVPLHRAVGLVRMHLHVV